MDLYLARGDQSLSDSIALDGRNPFRLPMTTFQGTNQSVIAGTNWQNYPRGRHAIRSLTQAWEAGDRIITHGILINDTTVSLVDKGFRDIVRKLEQGRRASGPYTQGTRVTLWYRRTNATNYVYFDVLDGLMTPIDLPLPDGDLWHGTMLALFCMPHARGAVITDAVTATYTNGTTNQYYRPNVPGDYDAPTKLTIDTTVSTGGVKVVRLTLGRRASDPALLADFTTRYKIVSVSPGVDTTDGGANYTGGHFTRFTVTSAWQQLGNAIQVNTGTLQQLYAQIKLRLRDSTAPLTPITNPTAVASGSGGSPGLPEGVYSAWMTTKDANGNESLPIAMPIATVPYKTTAFFDGAENHDTSLWTTYYGGHAYNAKGAVFATKDAAYTLGLPSLYGFRADAANGGTALLEKLVPGAGATVSLRCRMKINTNTATSNTNYTQIPILTNGSGTPLVSLFNIGSGGSGWYTAQAVGSGNTGMVLPEADWIRFEANVFWNGSLNVVKIYVNDSLVSTTNVSSTQSAYMCIGALTAGTGALQLDYDDVQLDTTLVGANVGSILYGWTPGTNGNGYNLYSELADGIFRQIAIATITTASYTLQSPTTGNPNVNPPTTVPAITPILWRVGARLSGAPDNTIEWSRVKPSVTMNANWETQSFGPLPLPPRVKLESDLSGLTTPPLWEVVIQAKAGSTVAPVTVGYPTADVDYFELFPFDEMESLCEVWSPGYTVSAAPKYVLSTRYDGETTCDILNSSNVVIGQALVKGNFKFGPHDNIVCWDAEIQTAGGLPPSSDVLNTKLKYTAEITPLYEHAVGVETWISDSFNRATALSTIDPPDTGQTYTVANGTCGVSNNHFYQNTVSVSNKAYARLDALAPNWNAVVRATLLNPGANEHTLIFRFAGASDFYSLFCSTAGYRLQVVSGGVLSSVAFIAQAAVANDAVMITVNGTLTTVAVNGINILTNISTPNFPNATIYGLGSNATATECWDSWSVKTS